MFKKKVTTGLIEEYLDRYGWKQHTSLPEPGEREGVVVANWSSPFAEGSNQLIIDPMVEKDGLQFRVPGIVQAAPDETPADRLNGLLLAIAALNSQFVMGAFAYRPTTGEVLFQVGIPIVRDELAYEDFEHCMKVVTATVDRYAADLRAVVDGTKTAQEVIG
jgi:hypothetical protein